MQKGMFMPWYQSIDPATEKKIAEGLIRLKDGFVAENMPKRNLFDSLLLATWNIREFGSGRGNNRNRECLYYLAEIVNCFDLVAIQEVRDNLKSLRSLMNILGGWWKCIYTDVTEGPQGNFERLAYVYDSRKIGFGSLAGEIVIPPEKDSSKKMVPSNQLARTPYMLGLKAGWFNFTICTVHILYGTSAAEDPNRTKEINEIAKFLAARPKDKYAWSKNMILLGDFNIFEPDDVTFKAITDAGFLIPDEIKNKPSNALKTHHFDQIAFIAPDIEGQLSLCNAGAFDFTKYVYRDGDEAQYAPDMGDNYLKDKDGKSRTAAQKTTYYKQWRTYQMSDHLPLWIELKIDFSKEYLGKKLKLTP
jgi:endonuclease/exonuclease/phosphatase family metal-dependent hydrolase